MFSNEKILFTYIKGERNCDGLNDGDAGSVEHVHANADGRGNVRAPLGKSERLKSSERLHI